jgi:uncharacterized protein (DUF488 family)
MQMGNRVGPDAQRLFSIGHSNHELARLLELLREAKVTAVADVRSQPFSRRHPQFDRPELERGLRTAGIAYVFLGDLLGGRPRDASLYDAEGRADYERMRATGAVQAGLERLCGQLGRYAVAMLCAEEDPLDCHRGLMITPALVERDLAPVHLRGDGSAETTAQMEKRLLAATRADGGLLDGLFAATLEADERQGLLADAYRLMSRRKAFRLPREE